MDSLNTIEREFGVSADDGSSSFVSALDEESSSWGSEPSDGVGSSFVDVFSSVGDSVGHCYINF